MTVVVIGAGISGLVAARKLLERGRNVIVLDAGELGGMIRTRRADGFTCECGPNVFVERPDMKRLLEELDLARNVRYPVVPDYKQFVWWNGAPRLVPKSIVRFAMSPLVTPQWKCRLPARLMRRGAIRPSADDESVATFFGRLIGPEGVERMLDPVLKGIYGGDADRLSARSLFPALWNAGASGKSVIEYMREKSGGAPKIFVLEGGAQSLTTKLAEHITQRATILSARAVSMTRDDGAFRLQLDNGEIVRASGVVSTIAGKSLADLLRDIDPAAAAAVDAVDHASLAMVHLAVPKSTRLIDKAFGVLFPGGMPESLLGVMFNSLIFPHTAPADSHILSVVLGGSQAGDYSPSEGHLQTVVPELLVRYLGIHNARWLGSAVWRNAIPQFAVGHHRVVETFDRVEAANRGFVMAGIDRGGVGVSDRIRLANEAVERLTQ